MVISFGRTTLIMLCTGIILLPLALPVGRSMAEQTPYFQLTLMVRDDPVLGYEEHLLAERLASQLQRLGIDVRVVNAHDLVERVYPGRNNPNIVPGPYEQKGYDMAILRTSFGTLNDLWMKMHTWETWDPSNVMIGVASPQLQNTELNQDLEAMLEIHPAIPAQEALERALYRLTWEFQPLIPLYQTLYARHFHVATLEGLNGLGGYWPELRWGHNGIEAWSFALGSDQSTIRLTTGLHAFNAFLPYCISEMWFYTYPSGAVLNGLLAPQGLEKDITPAAYVPDLANNLPMPVDAMSRLDGKDYRAEDQRIWELKIRSEITWHPGYGYPTMPFTIDDVLFTYRSLWNHRVVGPRLVGLFGNDSLKGVEAVNNTHLRFYLTEALNPAPPDGMRMMMRFLDCLTWPILPRHIMDSTYVSRAGLGKTADGAMIYPIDEWGLSDFNHGYRTNNHTGPAVIGTGPYRWEGPNGTLAFIPGITHVTLSSNDVYFKDNDLLRLPTDTSTPHRPRFVSFQVFPDNASAMQALMNGSVDVMWTWGSVFSGTHVPPDKKARQILLDDPRFDASIEGSVIRCLYLNSAHNHLTRPIRLAIAHAINREQLAQELAQVEEFPTHGAAANGLPLSLFHPLYPSTLPTPTYSLEKAWDYMEEAGYDMSPYRSKPSSPNTRGAPLAGFSLTAALIVLAAKRWRTRHRPIKMID